jgi:hypothetical protein
MMNPTAPPWQINNGRGPNRGTGVFRFSILSSLYVAATSPPILADSEPSLNFSIDKTRL